MVLIIISLDSFSQERLKVAVFSPIYLDSAFKGADYKLGLGNLPKNMLSGLDFYNGVMMAVDSLESEDKNLDVLFYDSKGSESIYSIIRKPEFAGVNMIISAFNNRQDIIPLAEIAQHRNIPLISSTFPNDGGVTNNPNFILINSSLKTHIEQIYRYLQKNFSSTHIIYVKRKGQLEDLIQYYLREASKSNLTAPFQFQTVDWTEPNNTQTLLASLDSTADNTIICGSLNEAFGIKLVKTLAANGNYNCTVMGMPTWDGLKDLDGSDCNGINIIYSTPYNFVRTQPVAVTLTTNYKNQLNGRPSDMFFKGYESMYHFCSLLIKHPKDFMNHLSDRDAKLFNDFMIEPIKSSTDQSVQYQENKKIYFIKKINGVNK